MRFGLATSTLSFLALGLAPVAAQSRTRSSGLERRVTSDTCANLDNVPLVHPLTGSVLGFLSQYCLLALLSLLTECPPVITRYVRLHLHDP